jgi:hypothetical protein
MSDEVMDWGGGGRCGEMPGDGEGAVFGGVVKGGASAHHEHRHQLFDHHHTFHAPRVDAGPTFHQRLILKRN